MFYQKKSHGLKKLLIALVIVLTLPIALLSTSCRTSKITADSRIEQSRNSDNYEKQVDTILVFCSDSVIVRTKGDTVFVDRLKYEFIYRAKRDTIARIDSVYIDKEVIIEKEKQLSQWQQWQMKGFWFLLVALLLSIIYTLIKKRLKPLNS